MEIGNNVGIANFILGKLLICTGPVHGTFRALHALIGGGNWNNGVHCGSRAVNCNNYPWNVNTNIGVRYMDDFIILSDDLEQLKEWVKRIEEFLENEMLLHINPKSTILYAGNGIDFCGYIHYADHKKVRKSSIRKLKQDVKAYELGKLPPEEFNRKYESRKGHLGHADTYHIAKAVEYELLFYEWERLEATA